MPTEPAATAEQEQGRAKTGAMSAWKLRTELAGQRRSRSWGKCGEPWLQGLLAGWRQRRRRLFPPP
jgi:hypothetical protein